MANIADFKAQMIGGGARPNQFRVGLTFPSYVTLGAVAGLRSQFFVKLLSYLRLLLRTFLFFIVVVQLTLLVSAHSNHGL